MIGKENEYFLLALREAERGTAVAQHAVGVMYDSGRGVAMDKAAALIWYQRAAGQGHPDSLFLLGVKYRVGDGVERDEERALHYFRLAAGRGRAAGALGLGGSDSSEPLPATKELPAAQYDLGRMYLDESCWLHDPGRAVRWLSLAAEGGVADAQYLLGMMLDSGYGIKADPAMAVEWLRRAAEGGHEEARTSLRSRLSLI